MRSTTFHHQKLYCKNFNFCWKLFWCCWWLLTSKKESSADLWVSHCSIVFSRAHRPPCSCRIFNGCCCNLIEFQITTRKVCKGPLKAYVLHSNTMASPVIQLDRGNNTTCTVNLHGCTIVSWRVNNQEQLFVSKVRLNMIGWLNPLMYRITYQTWNNYVILYSLYVTNWKALSTFSTLVILFVESNISVIKSVFDYLLK